MVSFFQYLVPSQQFINFFSKINQYLIGAGNGIFSTTLKFINHGYVATVHESGFDRNNPLSGSVLVENKGLQKIVINYMKLLASNIRDHILGNNNAGSYVGKDHSNAPKCFDYRAFFSGVAFVTCVFGAVYFLKILSRKLNPPNQTLRLRSIMLPSTQENPYVKWSGRKKIQRNSHENSEQQISNENAVEEETSSQIECVIVENDITNGASNQAIPFAS